MPQKYYDVVARNMMGNKKNGKKDRITMIILQPPRGLNRGSLGQGNGNGGIYTGAGPDGRIQPDMPAMVDLSDGRGKVLHEDETARPGNGGVNVTPSPLSRVYVPQTESEQLAVKQRENAGEFQGYQTGGTYRYANQNMRPDIPTPASNRVNVIQPNVAQQTGLGTPPADISPRRTPVDIKQPVVTREGLPESRGAGPSTTRVQPGSISSTRIQREKMPFDLTKRAPVSKIEPTPPVKPTPTPGPEVSIPEDIPPDLHNYYLEQYRDILQSTMDRQQAANLASQKARAQRSSASPYLTQGAREAMAAEQERTAGLATSDLAAKLAEKAVNMGFEAERLMLQREQLNFAKQQYGDEWGQRMAADINAGMTFDMLRQKYPDINITRQDYDSMKQMSPANWQQESWLKQFGFEVNKFNTATGQWEKSYDLAKEQWEKEFGFSIEQFQAQVDHWEKEFGFTKDSWQAQFDFAKQKYGDLEGQRIVMDINNGMSYDRIKEKYPNITLEDYNQIRRDGPLGQVDYNKKMDALNILLQGGDIEGAEEMLGKMFPDLNVDFSKLVDEQNQESFGNAMSTISRLIASGLDWDEAITALKADGTYSRLEKMGFDKDSMMKLYNKFQLSTNPIYQLTHTLDDDFLKTLWPDKTPEEARAIIARLAITGGIKMNEDGTFTFDKDLINEITGGDGPGGDDEPDYTYEDYAREAKAAGYDPMTEEEWNTAEKPKFKREEGDIYFEGGSLYKVGANGEPEEIFEHDLEEMPKAGDSFLADGDLYVMGDKGRARRISNDVLDSPWSDDAQKAIEYGEDSPYRDQLLDLRVKQLYDRTRDISAEKLDYETYKYLAANAQKYSVVNDQFTNGQYKPDTYDIRVRDDKFDSSKERKRYIINEYENLKENEDFVVVNGKVMIYTGKNRIKEAGEDGTEYFFKDARTGKTWHVHINGDAETFFNAI